MADWSGAIMTNQGRALEAKVTAGHCKLELTKLKVGDGESLDLERMTDLISPKLDIGISSLLPSDAGICDIEGVITNAELEKGFYMRELGIYATDPDEGEILYAVATDGHADYLQAKGGSTTLSVALHMQVAISNADSVTAVLNPKGLLTLDDLAHHDASPDAHASAIAKVIGEHDKEASAHAALASTINDALTPAEDTDTIRNLLSQLANRYKTGAGVEHWTDNPPITMAAVKTYMDQMASGSAVVWEGNKWHNPLTGEYGLMGQNGYICFGPNNGNLIIQWIYDAIPDNSYYRDFVLPVTLKSRPFVVVPADVFVAAATKIDSGFLTYSYGGSTPSSVRIATNTPTISAINAIIVGI